MAGGYRLGSGRSKSGYYKGIYCGSTYELCWAIHALDNNIKFSRFDKKLEKDGVIYFPDFLLDDGKTIIEPKGYENENSVAKKTILAESFGYIVKVMRKEDLIYAFDYVYKTYGTKKYYTLYDNYKPKYEYICDGCGTKIFREKKSKFKHVFCNRECVGKHGFKFIENYPLIKKKRKQTLNSGNFKGKLTKSEALEIFYNNELTLKELAKKFNICKDSILLIRSKKNYKWIHDENNKQARLLGCTKTYKENQRISFIKHILNLYLIERKIFKSFNEIAILISIKLSDKENKKVNRTTLFGNIKYSNLIKEYLANQHNL